MGEPAATTAVVLQPGYLPWLGFFDQMRRADVFVYYDDVQFDKNGWRNRNRVKSTDGRPCWLTVPVRHRGEGRPAINRIGIDRRAPWARKHVGTLRQHYSAAPHRESYLSELERTLSRDCARFRTAASVRPKRSATACRRRARKRGFGLSSSLSPVTRFAAHAARMASSSSNVQGRPVTLSTVPDPHWSRFRHPVSEIFRPRLFLEDAQGDSERDQFG